MSTPAHIAVLIGIELDLCEALGMEHIKCGLPPLVQRVRELREKLAHLDEGLSRYRAAYRFCLAENTGDCIRIYADIARHAAVIDWEGTRP